MLAAKDFKKLAKLAPKHDGFLPPTNEELIQMYSEQLSEAKKLLQESVYFINQVPNNKYKCLDNKSSYKLASDIDRFIDKI